MTVDTLNTVKKITDQIDRLRERMTGDELEIRALVVELNEALAIDPNKDHADVVWK